MEKKRIDIKKSHSGPFLESRLTVKGVEFLVLTEDEPKSSSLVTRIYKKGEVVTVRRTGYEAGKPEAELKKLIETRHEIAIKILSKEMQENLMSPADYVKDVKGLLKQNREKAARQIIEEALLKFPDDLYLLSYQGWLKAKMDKEYKEGIALCKHAIGTLHKKAPFGAEFFYPVLYLNLGRAYLASGRKKDAVGALKQGLSADPENKDILWEMRKLGARKAPVVSFLSRSHPVNRYLGKLRSILAKST